MVNGVKLGFRVGYGRSKTLTSCGSNVASALQHLDVELLPNRMVVIPPAQVPHIHCHISPFGLSQTKQNRVNGVSLSSPMNVSVNNGIYRDMCSICYIMKSTKVQTLSELRMCGTSN